MKKKLLLGWLFLAASTLSAQCFEKVFAGYEHFIAISQDGTLWAWGKNTHGQLGDGTTTERETPVQISTDTDWKYVSAGSQSNFAIKSDGTLWAWGNDQYERLGNGTSGSVLIPMQIGTDTDWENVSAGVTGGLAVKTNGTLWTWGQNIFGYLGNGMMDNYTLNAPTQLGTSTDWKSVSGRGYYCLALKENGTLWAWGRNHYGQLGIGNNDNQYIPVQVGTANDWRWIETTVAFANYNSDSYNLSIALKENNSFWLWGRDYTFDIDTAEPLQIETNTDWQTVSIRNDAGSRYALLVKQNGTLWAWGKDHMEQLGNGSNTGDYNVITQIGTDTDWKEAIATGGKQGSYAIKTDGTFWAWGATKLVDDGSGIIPSPMQYACTPIMAVSDADTLNELQIYPNPAKEIVNFIRAIDAELFNTTGKRILTVKNAKSLNVSALPKGIYIIVTKEGTTKKLIIK